MSTKSKKNCRCVSMAILLWGIMMVLVLVTVAFMWVFQIHFMERNYIESNISEVQTQVEAVLDDLKTEDLAYNEQLLSSLSHAADGKLLIVNGSGQLMDLYTLGHPIDLKENRTDILVWERIADGENYAAILAGILSRLFTSPILTIKKTVDALAAGDLTAKPGLKRRDEIGRLSCSVEKLGQALQRVDVLRKEVIANVSHELRSPLALIGGYAEMVRDITWKDDTQREENLNLIISEANRMSVMVSDILDYSQLQSGCLQLNRGTYDLCEIVEHEVRRCEQSAQENHLALSFDGPGEELSVRVDALKISQVVRNLLNNAINHTKDGETITASVSKDRRGFLVRVVNPGEPIPEEDRAIIWERYQRSQHQAGRRQGTGVGLSIVKTILDAHGMTCGVDCRDGLTCFWFRYPANPSSSNPS